MSEEKVKKNKTLIYVLLGCGILAIIVIVVAAFSFLYFGKKFIGSSKSPQEAIVKMMLERNPEVEVLEVDQDNNRIKIRNKKTGEIITIDYSQAKKGIIQWKEKGKKGSVEIKGEEKEGKIEISSEEGKTTITYGGDENLPDWLPEFKSFKILNQVTSKSGNKSSGTIELESLKDIDETAKEIENLFKEKGFNLNQILTQKSGGAKTVMLQGELEKSKTFFAIVNQEKEKTKCIINYSEKD